MAKLSVAPGSTNVSVPLYIVDATGAPRTGLAFNSAGLVAASYRTRAAASTIPLATLANASAAWSSGGFVEIDAALCPGHYRLDVPDAVVAAGARSAVVVLRGAANMVQVQLEIDLDAEVDVRQVANQPAGASGPVDFSALDNLDAAVSGLPTSAAVADKVLGRNLAGGADGGRTVRDALRFSRNRVTIDPATGAITVYAEDDATVAWTGVVTRTAGLNPISGVDPA